MQNSNSKINTILLIILIILALGIIWIQWHDRKAEEEKDLYSIQNTTDISQNENLPCNSNSSPLLTLISPNGGEEYQSNEQVKIVWEACNLPSGAFSIILNKATATTWYEGTPAVLFNEDLQIGGMVADDGERMITIPSSISSGSYKFWIMNEYDDFTGAANEDSSDDAFTILSAGSAPSTILPKYLGSNNWPPIIKTSTNTYSCSPGKSAPEVENSPTVVEKSINGSTYCISSFSDCGAGHCGGDYTYTTVNGSGTKTTTFNLQWNNSCGGYDGPEYDQCKYNQDSFFGNLDKLIDSLM
jgi:hypothetical protein